MFAKEKSRRDDVSSEDDATNIHRPNVMLITLTIQNIVVTSNIQASTKNIYKTRVYSLQQYPEIVFFQTIYFISYEDF